MEQKDDAEEQKLRLQAYIFAFTFDKSYLFESQERRFESKFWSWMQMEYMDFNTGVSQTITNKTNNLDV